MLEVVVAPKFVYRYQLTKCRDTFTFFFRAESHFSISPNLCCHFVDVDVDVDYEGD
jgi:hypothetical protein